jgi:hypothetical protein
MAALWQATILGLSGTELGVSLRLAHPDAGEFPNSVAFALRLIHEPAWEYDGQFQYRALGALGEAVTEQNVYDDDWLAGHAGDFIAEVKIESISGDPFDEASVVEDIHQGLRDQGLQQNTLDWDWGFRNAWANHWKNPPVPRVAMYRISATSAKWLNHLVAGQTWNSAAFD